MSLSDKVMEIVERSRAAEVEFVDRLSDQDRQEKGDYENWSAKDVLAHVNYWPAVRSEQIEAWLDGEGVKPIPQFEQSNLDCYQMFVDKDWDQIERYAAETHAHLLAILGRLDDEKLTEPFLDSGSLKFWEQIVGTAYTHKLIHLSDFYTRKGALDHSGQLWSEWAELVAPLDEGDEWQGRIHYNAACGLALAGDREGALNELESSLALQPSMKSWARLDSDLASLQGTDEFKQLIAPEYWWEALEGDPQVEAIADQYLRMLTMLREAVTAFSKEGWFGGETDYLRPAALALHIAQTIGMYTALKTGDAFDDTLMQRSWTNPDTSDFPDQDEYLAFLDRVEERLARFINEADLNTPEEQFPFTGSTKFSRVMYVLRHSQHHLADMAMELERRGIRPPGWS